MRLTIPWPAFCTPSECPAASPCFQCSKSYTDPKYRPKRKRTTPQQQQTEAPLELAGNTSYIFSTENRFARLRVYNAVRRGVEVVENCTLRERNFSERRPQKGAISETV